MVKGTKKVTKLHIESIGLMTDASLLDLLLERFMKYRGFSVEDYVNAIYIRDTYHRTLMWGQYSNELELTILKMAIMKFLQISDKSCEDNCYLVRLDIKGDEHNEWSQYYAVDIYVIKVVNATNVRELVYSISKETLRDSFRNLRTRMRIVKSINEIIV